MICGCLFQSAVGVAIPSNNNKVNLTVIKIRTYNGLKSNSKACDFLNSYSNRNIRSPKEHYINNVALKSIRPG